MMQGRRVSQGLILVLCLFAVPATALDETRVPSVDLGALAGVPILYNGRVMPMDSFARAVLLQFSGRNRVEGRSALHWLAEVLFQRDREDGERIILINHPDVVTALGLEKEKRRRYSIGQLYPVFSQLAELAQKAGALSPEERSLVEKELLRVFANVDLYLQIRASFSFAFPDIQLIPQDEALRERLQVNIDGNPPSYADLFFHVEEFKDLIPALESKAPESWSEMEMEAFRLSSMLFEESRRHRNLGVTLLPADPHGDEVWLSGWDLFSIRFEDPDLREVIRALVALPGAYAEGNQPAFDQAAEKISAFSRHRMSDRRAARWTSLEARYNQWNCFSRAGLLYFLGFLAAFVGCLAGFRVVKMVAWFLILPAFVLHGGGIVLRMLIMGRPPVTNLYATFLFVGVMVVLLGLILERVQKTGLGLLLSGFGGFSLLMIAQRFIVNGDTMEKVVAVLNSNFWLSTHVLAITTGYAGCFLAGILGHVYLLVCIFSPLGKAETIQGIYRAMVGILAFGLIFSFLGTMLGGIWADQSWGRFWGWDPKENGALLIVLWSAILFHARLDGMIGDRGLAAGCVLGVINVFVAWLGVNLLNVGLHSYGFTSGLAAGFFGVLIFEFLFVSIAVPLARRAGGKLGSAGGH